MNLFDKLVKHHNDDIYPYHMPGHKRNPLTKTLQRVGDLDITEIDGFDNLNHSENLLLDIQEHAAKVYGADESLYLVGGSTLGILSAISAVTTIGDTILIGRNCHKAVYHAAYLRQLNVEYVYPNYNEEWEVYTQTRVEVIRERLVKNSEIKAVVIVSPTYEGFCSDISQIAQVVHSFGKVLIVDEAHGAHLGFHPSWPKSAISQGADLIVQSLHKTLPSMTQTAIMHVCGDRVDRERLKRFLGMYQTSSPSYVFMASMQEAISYMEVSGRIAMENFERLWISMLNKLKQCEFIEVCSGAHDIGKLMISASKAGVDGQKLYDILLHRFSLQMEMAQGKYVLAMFTVADTIEAYDRLVKALTILDQEYTTQKDTKVNPICKREFSFIQADKICTIFEALEKDTEWVPLECCIEECAGEFVNLYPPGIPIIVPGEIFNQNLVNIIREYCVLGLPVQGIREQDAKYLVKILKRM